MKQEAFWVTPYGMELPWAGMDHDACAYIDGGCGDGGGLDGTSAATATRRIALDYPMQILSVYPSVRAKKKLTHAWRNGSSFHACLFSA